MDISALWTTVKTKLIDSPRTASSTITIAADHVETESVGAPDASFKSEADYFQVIINEMYLTRERHWFDKIDPVVYVVSQFSYNGASQVVPVLVGPTLLKDKGIPESVAKGTIFRNTSVAGPFPYRGKGLTLAVVLCEARSDNPLKPLLSVIESTSAALGFSPVTGPYTKVAEALINGFGALVGSGGVVPLVGLRDSYGPSYGTTFGPSYFALIDAPDVAAERLWVRNHRLMEGPSLATATEYRGADFVLYSIGCPKGNRRDDIDELPFSDLWKRVQKEAASPIEEPNYKNAKGLMATLFQEILLSPDLTEPQGDELVNKFQERMQDIHKRAVKLGAMAGAAEAADDGATERLKRIRSAAVAILES
jgi:hypothetical protein